MISFATVPIVAFLSKRVGQYMQKLSALRLTIGFSHLLRPCFEPVSWYFHGMFMYFPCIFPCIFMYFPLNMAAKQC